MEGCRRKIFRNLSNFWCVFLLVHYLAKINMNRMNNGQTSTHSPIILFATPPSLDKLLALSIRMTPGQTAGKFQPQVIKCREFIFTEPDVIGTPSIDIRDNSFHLISQAALINSGKLQTRMARIGLQVSEPFAVSPDLYEACLRYTLLARISPSWNKAGLWLIQGKTFLTNTGFSNAIKMDISVRNDELYFTLEAATVKTGPINMDVLDIPEKCLQNYKSNTATNINYENIGSNWCYVLPSMKRGRIVSISHELPDESPFMSYRDIKRHWKNTYGYRLPESEEDINYYQVQFSPLGGRLFTYPEVCLRPREIQKVQRVDPKPILRAFMLDIQAKFPTICGLHLKLQSKAKFTVAELIGCNEAGDSQANLTSRMSHSRPAVYRSKTEMERMLSLHYNNSIASSTAGLQSHAQPAVAKGQQKLGATSAAPCWAGYMSGSTVRTSTQSAVAELTHQSNIPLPEGHSVDIIFNQAKKNGMIQGPSKSMNKEPVNAETPQQNRGLAVSAVTHPLSSTVSRKLFPHFTPKKTMVVSSLVCKPKTPAVLPAFMTKNHGINIHAALCTEKQVLEINNQKKGLHELALWGESSATSQTSVAKNTPKFQKTVTKHQTDSLPLKTVKWKTEDKTVDKLSKNEKPKKRIKKDGDSIPKQKKLKKAET